MTETGASAPRDTGTVPGGGASLGETPPAQAPAAGHRVHRFLVPSLFVLATVVGVVAALAVWANRQALNTDNWTNTSSNLLANKQIDDAVSAYAVNQLFSSADVADRLRSALPPALQGLAGPAASGLQALANREGPQLLANAKVQAAWRQANRAAHRQLLSIINGNGKLLSTNGGEVALNLHPLVTQIAADLGLQTQVASIQSKLQGATGAQARTAAQQKLGITLPPSSGVLVVMRSNQLKTVQDIASALKGLAIVLPLLTVALFALAVWLARGRRRHALRSTGWCLFGIGLLLLLVRRIAADEVVNALVKVPANRPAAHQVLAIGTSLLYDIAIALIAYGLVVVLAASLAGPTRPAVWLRRALAPTLRQHPSRAYWAVAGALLLLIIWAPAPAFRQIISIVIFAALLALGVTALRRQTALEFATAPSPGASLPSPEASTGVLDGKDRA